MALKFTDTFKKIDLNRVADAASGVKSSVSSLFNRNKTQEVDSVEVSSLNNQEEESDDIQQSEFIEEAKKLVESAHELQEKVAQFIAENSDNLKQWYSDNKMNEKLEKVAKKVGATILYPVLMLYNLMKAPTTPVQEKVMIVVPLAYFILPADMLPDFIPAMGFADDGVAIMASIKQLSSSLTLEIQEQTKNQYRTMTGDDDTALVDSISDLIHNNQDIIVSSIAKSTKIKNNEKGGKEKHKAKE